MRIDWLPSCNNEMLKVRADILHRIRDFFYQQSVLEVDTPILGQFTGTDPYVTSFMTIDESLNKQFYLQASPEFAMKRLLASGSGSIYQMTKAFRQGESGGFHNPEFSMLEWYRVGFNLVQLMDDVDELFKYILPKHLLAKSTQRIAYVDIFRTYTGLNALDFDVSLYMQCAIQYDLIDAEVLCGNNHAAWLDFLFSSVVQHHLGIKGICMIYDYPACLPSLARFTDDSRLMVARIEIFIQGIEIGNGYFELNDVLEQNKRFDDDLRICVEKKSHLVEKDIRLLAALEYGLPKCAGIAVGLDRLLMVISGKQHIKDVLTFPVETA